MTLIDTIRAIETAAASQPAVNMIVQNDIFRLNACPEARYGVFGWTQGQHSGGASSDLIRYAFTFFYIDRLTEDQGNQIEVQSVGIQTLDNIIRQLNDLGIFSDDWTFVTFNQRFVDECAGVFCTVTLEVQIEGTCAEIFGGGGPGDFNDDYNDDFLIY